MEKNYGRKTLRIRISCFLWLSTFLFAGPLAAESNKALSGEQAFAACAGCHSVKSGEPHKVGPNLSGIVGKKAASAFGYTFSPALSDAELVWTRELLFAWIGGSESLVPGNWMLYHNVLSGEEVLNLIDYLEQEQ